MDRYGGGGGGGGICDATIVHSYPFTLTVFPWAAILYTPARVFRIAYFVKFSPSLSSSGNVLK